MKADLAAGAGRRDERGVRLIILEANGDGRQHVIGCNIVHADIVRV